MSTLKKWGPILDCVFESTFPYRQEVADYCERTTQRRANIFLVIESDPIWSNTLPMSLKILSKLNLKEKKLTFVGEPCGRCSGIGTIALTESHFATDVSLTEVERVIRELTEKVVEVINERMESHGELVVYDVVSHVHVVTDGTGDKITLFGRLEFREPLTN